MKAKRKVFRYPLFLACFIFTGIVLVFYFRFELLEDMSKAQFLADDKVTSFLIDTPGCQIPSWNPWDDSVKSLFEPIPSHYKCPGSPSFLRVLPNGVIGVEEALLQYYYEVYPESVSCTYREIIRNSTVMDENLDNRVSYSKPKPLKLNQPLNVDFLKTTCTFADKSRYFHEFVPITPLKVEVERQSTERQSRLKVKQPLNVIFLGIDSVSHLNFIRHFPKCRKYLAKFLSPITMNGYNKVGDNTFPNIVPLLTGWPFQHYSKSHENKFYDDLEYSWKAFSSLGYRTLLAEDAPRIATFNYFRNGFQHPPTDYYYRPFALAVEESDIRAKSKGQCFGSKMEMEVLYDYLKSFVATMDRSRPFFAFLFLARLTHDVFNFAGYADEPTYQLLKYLHENKFLDNTMMVFYSDHGIRYGGIRKTRIGQYEERLPFMHFILPKWFLEEYPSIHENLLANSKRLTTPFDIHATTLHLASLMANDSNLESKLKPGLSLFREIPRNRTCAEAGISPHWCTCQVSKSISKSCTVVQTAAETIIDIINRWTKVFKNKCSTLKLDKILDARVIDNSFKRGNFTLKQRTSDQIMNNYLIVISVSPSDAMFEATVSCSAAKMTECEVVDDISRINAYGSQSDCISDVVIKKFCYCL